MIHRRRRHKSHEPPPRSALRLRRLPHPHHPTSAKTAGAAGDLQIQVVRLEHTQTEDVAKALEETLASRSPSHGGFKIAVQTDQNALVLSGTTEQIREALELVAQLDSRPRR